MSGSPPGRAARTIEHATRLGGLTIALVQGVYLPLAGQSSDVNVPLLTLAAAMMAVAQAVKIDRKRREP